jgi:glucan phosphoethanolaminetransferase (alkaline phosphatase superfamily)
MAIALLEIFLCICEIVNACFALNLTTDPAAVSYILSMHLIVPAAYIVTALLVFMAIYRTHPRMVLPHLTLQGVMILVQLVSTVLVALWSAGISNLIAPLIAQRRDYVEYSSASEDLLFSLNQAAQRQANDDQRFEFEGNDLQSQQNADIGLASGTAALFLVVLGLEIWFIYLFLGLYRYLRERRWSMNACVAPKLKPTESGKSVLTQTSVME